MFSWLKQWATFIIQCLQWRHMCYFLNCTDTWDSTGPVHTGRIYGCQKASRTPVCTGRIYGPYIRVSFWAPVNTGRINGPYIRVVCIGLYSALPDPTAGGEGQAAHSQRNPPHCQPFDDDYGWLYYYATGGQSKGSKVRNVKVIPNKECVPKHKLLATDMWFNTTKRWQKKFEPRVHVWKLKEEKNVKNTKAWSKIKQWKQSGNTLM